MDLYDAFLILYAFIDIKMHYFFFKKNLIIREITIRVIYLIKIIGNIFNEIILLVKSYITVFLSKQKMR